MTLPELEEFLSRWGKERYRARQLFRWIYQKHAGDFAAMTDLSKELRGILAASCRISGFPAERVETSADGTEKYLFRLEDGEAVESVLIPDEGRRTLCISSQVGCPLLCGFCATGAAGFRRNMTSAEIVQQACFAAKRLAEREERLSNVVFMGMGEPLLNVPEVSRTIGILLSQFGFGISGKRVTVSTAGIVPEMLHARADVPRELRRLDQRRPGRSPFPPDAGQPEIPAEGGRRRDAPDPAAKRAEGDRGVRPAGGGERFARGRARALAPVPWRTDQGQSHSLSTRTKRRRTGRRRRMRWTGSGTFSIAGGVQTITPGTAGAPTSAPPAGSCAPSAREGKRVERRSRICL